MTRSEVRRRPTKLHLKPPRGHARAKLRWQEPASLGTPLRGARHLSRAANTCFIRHDLGLRRCLAIAWAAVCVIGVAGVARAQDTVVSAGVDVRFVSGSFGSTDTTRLVYAPAVLRVDAGRFEIAGYFPYLTIDDGSVTLSQGGFVPMRGTLTTAPAVGMPMHGGTMGGSNISSGGTGGSELTAPFLTNQSGFGDIVASIGYRIVDDRVAGLQVVLGTRVKFPTAMAARGLGTGRADVGGAATVRKRWEVGWIYGEAGYLLVGDPAGVDLRNAVLWAVGGGRRLTQRWYLLGSAYGNSAILRDLAAPIEIGAGFGVRLGERLTVSVLPTVGLTGASPRYGVTLGVSTDVVRR